MTNHLNETTKANLAFAEAQLAKYEALHNANPELRSAKFFKQSFKALRDEAKRDELLAQAEAASELIDFRFIGPRVEDGSMPLGQFIEVLDPLNRGLNKAAYRLRYGKESDRVGDDIKDSLNLKMSGVGYGSTRIFVTGDSRTDLTGNNLLSQTLTHTFGLLNADNETFFDSVDAVGGAAARKFGQALSCTKKFGLSAEFTWMRDHQPVKWHGRTADIDRLIDLIESTKEPEQIVQDLTGVVATIADTGIIYIRQGSEKVKIRYPMKLIKEAELLNMNMTVTLNVRTSCYYDAILRRDVYKHTLLSVK